MAWGATCTVFHVCKTNQFGMIFLLVELINLNLLKCSISLGLAKRLSVPDDYFYYQAITYQYFNLNNYFTGLLLLGMVYHNINYTVTLSRNNTSQTQYSLLGGQISVLVVNFLRPIHINKVDYSALGNNPKFQTVDAQGQRFGPK